MGIEVALIILRARLNKPWLRCSIRLCQTPLASLHESIPIYHWGDTDLGGFQIAKQLAEAALSAGHCLNLWMMARYDEAHPQKALSKKDQDFIQAICNQCGWPYDNWPPQPTWAPKGAFIFIVALGANL